MARAPLDKSDDIIRARIVKAAHDLFTKKGFQATSTAEISIRAEVAEPTLFHHFGSKVALFEASVLEPFIDVVDRWAASWATVSIETSLEELAESMVDGLYNLVWEDRHVFGELLVARTDPESALHHSAVVISGQFRSGLNSVLDAGFAIARRRGLVLIDPTATVGALASMIIGSVLLGDWAYPSGRRTPGRTRMVREMSRLVADGVATRQ